MTRQLSFLHLEDSQFSSKMIREQIESQWPGSLFHRVETEAEFRKAMEQQGFDLILADYSLPEFDGLAALQIAKQTAAEIPFIFVSGTMGEVVAIEAIKNGATDYVLKSGLFRLVPAIQRALQERAEQVEHMKLQGIIAKLQTAIEQAPLSIIMTDTDGVIEYVNPKLEAITGYSAAELLGKTPAIFKSTGTDPKTHNDLWATITHGGVWKGTLCNRKSNGELYYESTIIAPVKDDKGIISHYIGIKEDITERQALEAQLHQAQKMEIIGQLASGIAHDFNNILTVIACQGAMLRIELAGNPQAQAMVDTILQSEIRASELTRSLLNFTRKGELKLTTVSLNEVILGLQKSFDHIIRKNIQCAIELSDYPLVLKADKGQIEQVIFNLAINASDAMPDGGKLLMGTEAVLIAESDAKHGISLEPGRYALITVADSGGGMDDKILGQIFDPFFTTKETGKGTGLGLAIVRGIIKKHGGEICVQSKLGSGTTFKIYLPLMEHPLISSQIPEIAEVPGGKETVLIVDSDPELRKTLTTMLSLKGYHPLQAENGEEGFHIFSANQDEIKLIMADNILPKKSGREMCQEICRLKADLPIIFMSGYADENMNGTGWLSHNQSVMLKPINRSALLAKVREMLDDCTPTATA